MCEKIIPYVVSWGRSVTDYHKKYSKEICTTDFVEVYIRMIALEGTLRRIF